MDAELFADPGFQELVREFVADLEDRVAEMRSVLEEADWESLEVLSHRLKGAAGGYGFESLSRTAARIEQCCRGARAAGEVEALLAELESEIPNPS